jgi:hypothetical protein
LCKLYPVSTHLPVSLNLRCTYRRSRSRTKIQFSADRKTHRSSLAPYKTFIAAKQKRIPPSSAANGAVTLKRDHEELAQVGVAMIVDEQSVSKRKGEDG